jgi:glutathione S-transferase
MHKGLSFDTIPWRFTDNDAIAFSGQGRVPVLLDGDRVVFDSWTIATYLEDAYADRPSLFRGDGGRATTRFINAWADSVLVGGILRLVVTDIFAHLHEKDRAYFRETREKRLGATLEAISANRETRCTDVPQDLGASSRRSCGAAIFRRRGARLRRLCRVRLFPMGAVHQSFSVAAQRRSGLGLA